MIGNKTSFISSNEKENVKRFIRSRLVLAGVKQCEIADTLGVKSCVVSLVLSGRAKSHRIFEYMLNTYNIDVEKLYAKENVKENHDVENKEAI
jgi:transcriptional regulator with XRE-family HTH domain